MVKEIGSDTVLEVVSSVTAILGLKVPEAVGVPETTPAELNARPAGSVEPEATAQVYGGTPPDAVSWKLYAVPTVPGSAVVEVIFSVPLLIARVRLPETAVCGIVSLSETCTVTFAAPAVVGVPAITPAALRERPAGRVPDLTVQL
jgi:hypothetical protein